MTVQIGINLIISTMTRIVLIIMLFMSCSKPDDTIFEPEENLICVDCFDQISHMAFLDVFCGSEYETDRFIVEAKETARAKGMLLHCEKHK